MMLIGEFENIGDLLGIGIVIDVGIADEQRTAVQHQIVHGRQRRGAGTPANHLADDAEVLAVLAIGAADEAEDSGTDEPGADEVGGLAVTRLIDVSGTDADRGLIMVKGSVPGNKGGWVTIKDAVKKPLPKDAPKPGKFKVAEGEQAAGEQAKGETKQPEIGHGKAPRTPVAAGGRGERARGKGRCGRDDHAQRGGW